MPFPFDKYPSLNFQELNLAYFIRHFQEIFSQWDQLYNDLTTWRAETTQELEDWSASVEAALESWKTGVEGALETWKTGVESGLEDWKDLTEQDIQTWEQTTIAALNAWQTQAETAFEIIRAQAAASATAAENSAIASRTARTGAETAQAAAEAAAAGVESELAQIQTNTEGIDFLQKQSDAISSSVFNAQYAVPVLWENGSISSGTEEVADSQRKRSAEFMDFWNAPQIDITVPTGKRIITFVYSAPDLSAFESTITWKSVDFSITPNGKYYRFVISNDPEGETRVSEDGFIFSGSTYAERVNIATNGRIDNLISTGHNLLNPDDCVDRTTISTAGVPSSNPAYWATGFINVSEYATILIPTARILREVFYDVTKETAVGYIGGARNPVSIPAGAAYMRVVFYKDDVDYENRATLSIIPTGTNAAFESYHAFNGAKTLHDNQFFYVNAGTYTETFTIRAKRGNQGNKNMIVAFKGYYSGETAPTIQFSMKNAYADTVTKYFTSQVYVLGNNAYSDNKEWRIPAFPPQAMDFDATITIPEGTTLTIEYLYNRFDDFVDRNNPRYILEAHLGTLSIYPQNTMISFQSAAKLGYPACVAVPKRTSDGVWVCFHDDDQVGRLLRNPDGTALSVTDAEKTIDEFTYAELLEFSAGALRSPFYAGEKVPRLDAFFSLCQKTGMHPVLSIHPVPTAAEWAEIKTLAKKYNVLQTLAVKIASISSIEDAYDVLGDDIEFYIYENGTNNDNTAALIALGLSLDHAKLCTEYFDMYIDQPKVTNGLNNGLLLGCYVSYGTAARYKELLEMGVTFITDDNNNSYGLNW